VALAWRWRVSKRLEEAYDLTVFVDVDALGRRNLGQAGHGHHITGKSN
jgi:hypothetical protein